MKAKVILNEQHTLLPEQKSLLDAEFGEGQWEVYPLPKSGLNKREQRELALELAFKLVVIASPCPLMSLCLAAHKARNVTSCALYLFHADQRTAEEAKNADGEEILKHRLQKNWKLVRIV